MKKSRLRHRQYRWMPSEGASLDEIERVYRQRLPEFRRVAAAILGNREAARDAVQDGFALAVRKRTTFRGDGPLEAWLWRVVVNAAREQQRHGREVPRPDAAETRRNGTLEDEADARVRVALSLLPERQRLVLFLRYYADLDYRTIAETLDIAPGTVGVTLSTARARLEQLLAEPRR
jgi:RNA polymerase sigma-70 factor, ECF subfamily